MYCPNCGKKNDPDARFCSFCGGELVENQPESVSIGGFLLNRMGLYAKGEGKEQLRLIKGWLLHRKALVAGTISLLVVVIALAVGVQSFASPDRVAENAFVNAMNGNWERLYGEIYLPEGEMLTRENFVKAMEKNDPVGYLEYEMEAVDSEGNELYKEYIFTYSEPNHSSPSQMRLTLVRDGKKALFFDNYKLVLGEVLAENCEIRMPEGAVLYVDGERLGSTDELDGEAFQYTLPTLFVGEYTFTLEHPAYVFPTLTTEISSGTTLNFFSGARVDLSQLEDATYGDVKAYAASLYRSALEGNMLEASGVPVSTRGGENLTQSFYELQENLLSSIPEGQTFNISMVSLDQASVGADTGDVTCYLTLQGSLSDGRAGSCDVQLRVVMENGVWALAGLNFDNDF